MRLLSFLLPVACLAAKLEIQPPVIQLHGSDATQLFIVSYTDDAGYEHDVTGECAASNIVRSPAKKIEADCRGLRAYYYCVIK